MHLREHQRAILAIALELKHANEISPDARHNTVVVGGVGG